MTSRDFDTGTWSDKWFRSLADPSLKLLFLYLWTNDHCNPAGCYEIDPDLVELQCKVSLNGNTDSLTPKVEYFKSESIIWIKNFFRRQCKNTSFAISAIRSLKNYPPEIKQVWYDYNSKLLKSLGLNTQCKDGLITVLPQTYKTRPDKTSLSKDKHRRSRGSEKQDLAPVSSFVECKNCHTAYPPHLLEDGLCKPCKWTEDERKTTH